MAGGALVRTILKAISSKGMREAIKKYGSKAVNNAKKNLDLIADDLEKTIDEGLGRLKIKPKKPLKDPNLFDPEEALSGKPIKRRSFFSKGGSVTKRSGSAAMRGYGCVMKGKK